MKRKKMIMRIRWCATIVAAAIIAWGSCYLGWWLTGLQRNLEISGIKIAELSEIKYIPIVIIIALIVVLAAIPLNIVSDKTE